MHAFVILLIIALIGVVAWALMKFVPMPVAFKNIILVAAIVIAIAYLIYAFSSSVDPVIIH